MWQRVCQVSTVAVHTSHVTRHTYNAVTGAILVDQGLVVASTWVKAVLLPHILLDSGGSAVAAAQAPKLHVNRRVAPVATIPE